MKKSFTLIELLVVIAIIGSLSAILLPNFMGARERARDSQRKSDIKQVQKAFELYRMDQSPPSFPYSLVTAGTCFSSGANCTGNIYMSKFPTDPNAGRDYFYSVDNVNLTYLLCACLENKADPDGTAGDCAASYACSSGKKYFTTQP